MTLELAIVDESLTIPLLNLNGLGQGNPTGFEVKQWNLGQVTPEMELVSNPAYPGAVQTVVHHPPVDMELTLQAQDTSYNDLRDLVGSLVEFLREGGFMRYKLDGQTEYHFIEFFGSQLPQLMRGENEVTQKYIVERFQDLTGFPLVIKRQPYVFRETRNVLTDEFIQNNGVLAVSADVEGDLPALTKISISVPSSSAEVVRVRIGRRSTGDLAEYVSDHIRYDILSPPTLLRRWRRIHRKVLTPSDPTSLIGTYRVFAAVQLDGADEYHLQLRWGTTNDEPAGAVNNEVVLDTQDASATMNSPADVNLGTVRFDRSSSNLVLEIWARREGTGEATWTDVFLLPVSEQSCRVQAPGLGFGRFGREWYTGNELTRAGGASLDDDDRAILNDTNEYAETTAINLPVGFHMVQFVGTVINYARTRTEVGKLQILEEDLDDVVRTVKLMSRRKHSRIHYDWDTLKQVVWKVTDTSKNYKWRVIQTVNNTNNRAIKVARLVYSYLPILHTNRKFVIDGIEREAYIANSSGERYYPAHLAGPFLTLNPGENILVFRLGDASTRAVYRDADARGVLTEMRAARSATVTIDVRERLII